MKNLKLDESELKRTEAIICSMTEEERQKPQIINGSRRKRIARGSGTRVQDINQLINQFGQLRTVMKRMSGMKGRRGGIPNVPFPFN
jgi:signal recognition particle subunit SRP54